jgi:hypothetical protein
MNEYNTNAERSKHLVKGERTEMRQWRPTGNFLSGNALYFRSLLVYTLFTDTKTCSDFFDRRLPAVQIRWEVDYEGRSSPGFSCVGV